ncbi:MAG TPA: glycosyltransferase [Acidimicrobiia bacterium]|nr:glycosyltransferase [Acidimicrobiia bacterium]
MDDRETDTHSTRAASPAPVAELSIVIPCRNVAAVLPRQLDALARERWGHPWEVVIADNGSTDDTRTVATSFAHRLPALRIVDAGSRAGRQYACNEGAKSAGRAVVFVDADDEIAPNFVAAMGDALAEHPVVAAAMDHEELNDGWVRAANGGFQSRSLQNGFGFLPFGGGGTLGVQRAVFDAVGYFADDMDYAEDVDFCWRAQLAGFELHFEPDARLRYQYRPRVRAMYRQHRNFGEGSALLYRTYRDRGMPRRTTRAWLREWYGIARGLLAVRSRADAARWSRRCGRAIGRLRGSVRYRVWFP